MWEEDCGWEACRMQPLKPGCWLCAQIRAAVLQGASARREVSFFTQHDTVHALKVTGIFGLHTSTRPADYMQTHPRCLFWERRRSACQPSLGRGPFAKSDGWWEFRLSLWSPYLNLNAREMFSDYGEVMLMYRPYPVILLFIFLWKS